MKLKIRDSLGILGVIGLLYLFLVSIDLMGISFKLFGKDFAHQIINFTSSPFVGLFIGLLVTSLVQSSSTTTSMVVSMVAGGALTVPNAIPIIMGANIGTSITNTIVSLAHISRKEEFRRAFAASTIHDFFNLMAVIILFPLQYFTNFLGIFSEILGQAFQDVGGLKFTSPIKVITKPFSHFVTDLVNNHPIIVLIIGLIFLFISLKYLVKLLRSIVLKRIEGFFDEYIFKTAIRAFIFGVALTTVVQSSSITTSIVIPLAGAGILSLRQIYPYTLGANIGTTITAILASLVSGTVEPVAVAFSHLLFNVSGITIITTIKFLREIPIKLAETLAKIAVSNRWLPIVYVIVVFFIIPISLIFIAR